MTSLFKITIALLLSLTLCFVSQANPLCQQSCTFVLKHEATASYQFINSERAHKRMTPWSTFKIANSLIALDSGVVKGIDTLLSFDTTDYPIQSWWPKVWYQAPISLASAYKYSAVPIYQTIARSIGNRKMKQYLANFQYGDQNISSGIDNFWLNNSIHISAKEQVDFLQRLNTHQLAVSKQALIELKKIMLVEATETYKLYAKTGTGNIAKNKVLGWYVGFVENQQGTYYFALNIDGKSLKDVSQIRIKAAREQLALAGIL